MFPVQRKNLFPQLCEILDSVLVTACAVVWRSALFFCKHLKDIQAFTEGPGDINR